MSQDQSTRRGRPGYDQQGILAVAVTAFNEYGYDATSIGVLAERLNLSKSAIYHHFGSKDEILELALDAALSALEGVVDEVAQPAAVVGDRPAADRLEHVLRGAVHVLVERLPAVTLLLRVRGNTDVERRALTRRRAFDRFWRGRPGGSGLGLAIVKQLVEQNQGRVTLADRPGGGLVVTLALVPAPGGGADDG